MNTVNTKISVFEVWFTDQTSKATWNWRLCKFDINYWVVFIKMRYSTEPKFRKYVKGYGILSFARKLGNKYGKKLMDTTTKTWIDAAKTTSKRVVQKPAKATEDFIGNKIADKTTLIY